MTDNRNKDVQLDESVLEETPPNINEPQKEEDKPENQDPNPDKPVKEVIEETVIEEKETEVIEDKPEDQPKPVVKPEVSEETVEQKEQRYKAQQTEAQIQAARNRALTDKVDEAAKIPEPTIDDLRAFVAQDGGEWDMLTPFEQATAKRLYVSEKRFSIVNDAVQITKKIDEWKAQVDAFIDKVEDDPKFVKLSGHEADFRKFAMKESHRGAPIDTLLLPAFLQNLPAPKQKRASLFPTGGGGEKSENPNIISDADQSAALRATNPKEWARKSKAGLIKVEV